MANDALCFDLFGTLCSKAAVEEAFVETVSAATDLGDGEIESLLRSWEAKRSMYTCRTAAMGESDTYRGIAAKSLAYTLECHGVDLDPGDQAAVLDAFSRLDAYPGAADALATLGDAGFEITVLSNGDPGLLREIVRQAGLDAPLDRIISAGDSGVFKPAPAAYRHAADVLKRPIGRCWLVTAHDWDARGGAQAGMLGAWINRDGRPDDRIGRPPAVAADSFEGIVEALSAEA